MSYLGEKAVIKTYFVGNTSALENTMPAIDCSDCDQVSIILGLGSTAGFAGGVQPVLSILQAENTPFSTSAGVATAAINLTMGSTASGNVVRAQSALVTMTTVNTGNVGETLVVNGVTLTVGTTAVMEAASTNYIATSLTFGSSLLSTVAEGLELQGNGLAAMLNSTAGSSVFPNGGFGSVFRATTLTTAIVKIDVINDQELSSGLTITGSSGLAASYRAQTGKIEFPVAMLNSTSKYIRPSVSTISSAIAVSLTVIKEGMRYKPSFHGNSVIAINATDVNT
jgi:hypothetical protein